MHDMGKGIEKLKHGQKSKGKGVGVEVSTKAKVKTWTQGPIDDYELTFVAKRRKKKSKVMDHQTM